MASSSVPNADEEAAAADQKEIYDQLRHLVSTYPTEPSDLGRPYTRHPDGWYAFMSGIVSAMVIRDHLKVRDTDIFLATFPKCGTTWLKALVYATIRRTADGPALAPLCTNSPHQVVPFLECQVLTSLAHHVVLVSVLFLVLGRASAIFQAAFEF